MAYLKEKNLRLSGMRYFKAVIIYLSACKIMCYKNNNYPIFNLNKSKKSFYVTKFKLIGLNYLKTCTVILQGRFHAGEKCFKNDLLKKVQIILCLKCCAKSEHKIRELVLP